MCSLVYILLSAAAAWLFYDSFPAMLLFAPFFILFIKAVKAAKKKREERILTEGFIRSLISLSTSLAAGESAENAFISAQADMEKLYAAGNIVRELSILNSRVAAGRRIEDALFDLAKRAKIPEIYDFAVVFAVAREKGSDFPAVISSCVQVMETKRQTESEAWVLIRSKQYEQRIMCVIPPGILLYLRISSGSFTGILYHNAVGAAVMTLCLAVYVLAFYLSEKIGDIKV